MKLVLVMYSYICANCGNTFKVAQLPPNVYGQFLLRSSVGKEMYLNALTDKVFSEIRELIKEGDLQGSNDEIKITESIHSVFGITCDVDESGNRYEIDAMPTCPRCGRNEISYWEQIIPAEVVKKDIPDVTHVMWAGLSLEEKKKLISEKLDESEKKRDTQFS